MSGEWRCAVCRQSPGEHAHSQCVYQPEWVPAAPVVQGADGLREALRDLLVASYGEEPVRNRDAWLADADAVLALPEVVRLYQAQAALAAIRAAIARHSDNLTLTQLSAFNKALTTGQALDARRCEPLPTSASDSRAPHAR